MTSRFSTAFTPHWSLMASYTPRLKTSPEQTRQGEAGLVHNSVTQAQFRYIAAKSNGYCHSFALMPDLDGMAYHTRPHSIINLRCFQVVFHVLQLFFFYSLAPWINSWPPVWWSISWLWFDRCWFVTLLWWIGFFYYHLSCYLSLFIITTFFANIFS